MSHVTDGRLKIKDLDALEDVLAERFPHLELRLVRVDGMTVDRFTLEQYSEREDLTREEAATVAPLMPTPEPPPEMVVPEGRVTVPVKTAGPETFSCSRVSCVHL